MAKDGKHKGEESRFGPDGCGTIGWLSLLILLSLLGIFVVYPLLQGK